MCDICKTDFVKNIRRSLIFSIIDGIFDTKLVHRSLKGITDTVDDGVNTVTNIIDGNVTSGSFDFSTGVKISHRTYRRMKTLLYFLSTWVYDAFIYPQFKDQLYRLQLPGQMCLCKFYEGLMILIVEQIYCIWYQNGFSAYSLINDIIAIMSTDFIDGLIMGLNQNTWMNKEKRMMIPLVPVEQQKRSMQIVEGSTTLNDKKNIRARIAL